MIRALASLSLLLASGSAAAFDLTVSPVMHGMPVDLVVDGCTDGTKVVFFASLKDGSTCPAALGGQCLDMAGPKPIRSDVCVAGTAVASIMTPKGLAAGTQVRFQAAVSGAAAEVSDLERRWIDGWADPVTVDGDISDWSAADAGFSTTSGTGTNYVTWDEEYLYIATAHPDVAFGGSLHWFTAHIGTAVSGTTTGTTLGSQTPTLPAPVTHQLRWKADNSYHDLAVWDGAMWAITPWWLGMDGSFYAESDMNQVLEIAIPWGAIGDPAVATVHLAWVYEGAGFESTYAGSPATSFVDGYDPDFGAMLVVDRRSSASPVVQNP